MRICIDVSQIVYGTGVSTYTRELVRNLSAVDKENEYLLFAGALRRRQDILNVFPNARIFPLPPTIADIIWNRLHIFPIEKLVGEIDVLHTSDWTEPPSKAFKVTTVHDLSPFLFPNLFPRDLVRNIVETHKRKLNWVRQEANRIIVPTRATNDDLTKMGFDEAKIRIIPEAPSKEFKKVSELEIERVKRRYKIFGNFILSVGMDPRKNTQRAIKAFEKSAPGKNLKLVFVGLPKYIKIRETRNIRILGRVPTGDLVSLYSGARALLYPSLYEGFGLPILEAFACSCPVVTSNIVSTAEVANGAAELVDPTDIGSIAEGIEKVLRGPKAYALKGLKRVAEFSWEKTASATLRVYQEASK